MFAGLSWKLPVFPLDPPGQTHQRPRLAHRRCPVPIGRLDGLEVERGVHEHALAAFGSTFPERFHERPDLPRAEALSRDGLTEPLAGPLALPRQPVESAGRDLTRDLATPHPGLHGQGQRAHDLPPAPHPSGAPPELAGDLVFAEPFGPGQLLDEPALLERAETSPPQPLPQRQRRGCRDRPHRRGHRVVPGTLQGTHALEALHHDVPRPFGHHDHSGALGSFSGLADRRRRTGFSSSVPPHERPVPKVQLV